MCLSPSPPKGTVPVNGYKFKDRQSTTSSGATKMYGIAGEIVRSAVDAASTAPNPRTIALPALYLPLTMQRWIVDSPDCVAMSTDNVRPLLVAFK